MSPLTRRLALILIAIGIFSDDLYSDSSGTCGYVFHNRHGFESRLYADGRLLPGEVNPQNHHLHELEMNKRTWILFSQSKEPAEKHFLKYFLQKGKQSEELKDAGAALYLFTL